jgi:putative ABC transport system permease protein
MRAIAYIRSGWYRFLSGVGVALHALSGNKFRTSMTSLGIVIGVMTITVILSIIEGLDRGVEEQMNLMGVRTLFVSKWSWGFHRHWHKFRNRPPITDWDYRRLREQVPFAIAMAPWEMHRGGIEFGTEKITDVEVYGTNSEFSRITGYSVDRGRFFSPADIRYERPFVVLGAEVASKLFGASNPLGENVVLRGVHYRVIGVLKAQGSFLGRSQDVKAIIPTGRFRRSFGSRRSLSIAIKVAPQTSLAEAEEDLRGIMRRVRGLRPLEEDDFSINQQKMMNEMYESITGKLYLVILVVGLISLAIGGIGIMNIMLVSVTERTREIGIRKALGARQRTVLFQFLIESLVLSALGGLLGLVFGFGGVHVVDAISPLPARVSLFAIGVSVGTAALTGMFFGIYPAWRAARLDPIVALRYE